MARERCLSRWQTSGDIAQTSARVWRVPGFCFRGLHVMRSNPDLCGVTPVNAGRHHAAIAGLCAKSMSAGNAKTRGLPSPVNTSGAKTFIRRLLEQTPGYAERTGASGGNRSNTACIASFAMPMGVPCLIICAIAAARASLSDGGDTACGSARMSGYQHATSFATAFRRRAWLLARRLRDASLTASATVRNAPRQSGNIRR